MAMAVFTSRPNSHPFEERRVPLTEPVKIGRSVAKSRPATNNCIFDCKVLSRNHAIFWFEDGKFFLQDTKSSNGTFVNNVRLSKGSEESEPKELKSGDIVQFGVDVVENSKKVTHGCIVATVTLFLPDGKEATKSGVPRSLFALNENGIQAQEMWQLSQYLQDALYREQMLETKLASLQRLISDSQSLVEDSSQAFAQEDKLLSRLETLENHLETLTRNVNEDDIAKELLALQEDRHNYEMRAKESLKKVLQEKLEAIQKLTEVERSCSTAEDECVHFKSLYERSQQELQDLAEKHKQRLQEMQKLQEQVEEAERRHTTVEEQALQDKAEFEMRLKEAQLREAALAAKAESLQAECDFTTEQVAAMKVHMDKTRDELHRPEESIEVIDTDVNGTGELETLPAGFEQNSIQEAKKCSEKDYSNTDDIKILHVKVERLQSEVCEKERILESLLDELEETRLQHSKSQNEIQRLKDQVNKAKAASLDDKEKIQSLEEQVLKYHLQAVDDFSIDEDSSMSGVDHLDAAQPVTNQDTRQLGNNSDIHFTRDDSDLVRQLHDRIREVKTMARERHLMMISWSDEDDEEIGPEFSDDKTLDLEESCIYQTRNARQLLQDSLHNVQDIKGEFIEIGRIIDNEHDESQHVQGQLNDTQQELKENNELVVELQEELKNAQTYTKDFKQQILDLRDKLLEEQDSTRKKDDLIAQLKREVNELIRERDLLSLERKCEHHATETAINNAREMQKQAAKSAKDAGKNKVELNATMDDNRFLKQRIQILESELKKYRRENNRLTSDQSRLQATYREIENQSRLLSEKIMRQQHTMKGKIEREISEKKITEDQASALEERLQETKAKLKEEQESARKKVQELNDTNSQLLRYLMAGLVAFVAFIVAYALGFVELAPGWRTRGLWS